MSTIYWVQDDEWVAAGTPTELVEYLARTSKMPVQNAAAFRHRAAYWAWELRGRKVRTDTDAHFVEDMIRVGAYRVEGTH